MPELIASGLTKRYGDGYAIQDVNFTVRDGEFFTLLGPSGCGKSTTLSSIAGLLELDEGKITVGDRTVFDAERGITTPPERRQLGMVFQSYALWPHMSVRKNVELPLSVRRTPRAVMKDRVDRALDRMGLSTMGNRYPHELSGGQQQRAALARSLAYEPSLLLLDEPLSNLDARLRDSARASLKQLQSELGVTTVYVTHDQIEALSLSDRIAVMGEGCIIQIGTPAEIYGSPATLEVASFIGECNFLPATVAERRSGGVSMLRLADVEASVAVTAQFPDEVGSRVTLAIRPEHVIVSEGGVTENALDARLESQLYIGARHEYRFRVGAHLVQAEGPRPLSDQATMSLPPDKILVFSA